jgi:hypothetical protein
VKADRIRGAAWVVLLVLAGAQAWLARFYVTPDGVSYMDLSDAVVSGAWGELLNAYWSPLYPVLIGGLRFVLRPTPYSEFVVVHLLNLFLFAASLAGFEYLLSALRTLGRTQWSKPGLDTAAGRAGAYAVFGLYSLVMTPLVLPTPDLLVSAACLFVFGALLRLRYDIGAARAGGVLGVALAVGSLAKSFAIPWAGICLLTALVASRGRSMRPVVVAGALWLLAVVPWTVGLSMKYGHVTFGDTGRLTYAWFVTRVESPSAKRMPSAAATPATDAVLRGIAITPNAPGTNPVWYDPARWWGDLQPRFDVQRQAQVLGILVAEYIASLAPVFLVLAFWLIAAGRDAIREWWARTWPVTLPVFAALAAYSLVLVTSRYVAPFYVALTLVVLCGARWPERIPPARMLMAIGIPLLFMIATPEPQHAVALVNAAASAVPLVWMMRHRAPSVQIVTAVLGGVVVYLLQPFSDLRSVALMSVLLILAYWAIARATDNRGEWPIVSPLLRRSLVAAQAVLILAVGALKYGSGLAQGRPAPRQPGGSLFAAEQASAIGIGAGSRIALVGSPFEQYWARAARAKIVAVVSLPQQAEFNRLSADGRRRLYAEFARAGADFIVVQQESPPADPALPWRGVPSVGWVARLR